MITNKYLTRFLAELILVPVMLAAASCSMQTESEKAAALIVKKNVVACGGLDAWRATQSMTMTGQMDAGKVRQTDTDGTVP